MGKKLSGVRLYIESLKVPLVEQTKEPFSLLDCKR